MGQNKEGCHSCQGWSLNKKTIITQSKYITIFQVCADATLVFPILVAETFAKHHFSASSSK